MSGLVMRSKPQSRVILLLAIAFFIGMHIFGDPICRRDSQKTGSQNATEKTAKTPNELSFDLGHGVKIELVLIPAGALHDGGRKGRCRRKEKPVHKVKISQPFYMGKFEVTRQWPAVMGDNHSRFKGARKPVDHVSWDACQAFCRWLAEKSAKKNITFACLLRPSGNTPAAAGSSTEFGFGNEKSG